MYRLSQAGNWYRVYPVNFPFNVVSGRGNPAFATTRPMNFGYEAYRPYPDWGGPKRRAVTARTKRRTYRRPPIRARRMLAGRRFYSRAALGKNVRYRRGPRGVYVKARRGTFTRNRVLNPVSQRRTIRIRQQINIAIASDAHTATAHGLDTVNSITQPVLKLCVSTQPYSAKALLGGVRPYHAVSGVADGTLDHFGVRCIAGVAAWDADLIAVVQRYASFRTAAMKVSLTLNEQAMTPSGTDSNWVNASRGRYVVRSCFDRLDTQQIMPEIELSDAALAYPLAPNLYQMRRLPYYTERPSSARYHEARTEGHKYVLFNRRFPAGNMTGSGLLVTGATSIHAVAAGGWDNRAIQEGLYGNAYEVMNAGSTAGQKMYRAGKLWIDIRPEVDTNDLTWLEFFNGSVANTIIGRITVEFIVELKNDIDAFRPT